MVEALNAAGFAALGSTDLTGRHGGSTTAHWSAVRPPSHHRGRSSPTEAAGHLLSLFSLFSGPDEATLEHQCDYPTNGLHFRNL